MDKPKAQSGVGSSELVMRLRLQADDLRIMEHLSPFAEVNEQAAARLEKLEAAWELLVPYMQSEPSSDNVKQAWDNLEAWWKRNAA